MHTGELESVANVTRVGKGRVVHTLRNVKVAFLRCFSLVFLSIYVPNLKEELEETTYAASTFADNED